MGDPASEICSREEALLKLSELLQVEIAFQWSYSLRNIFHESLRCCGHMVRKGPQKFPKLWLGNIVQWWNPLQLQLQISCKSDQPVTPHWPLKFPIHLFYSTSTNQRIIIFSFTYRKVLLLIKWQPDKH